MGNFFKFVITISIFFFSSLIQAECSDLSQTECEYWSEYCSWNAEQNICEEIGGVGGDDKMNSSSWILNEFLKR